MLVTYGGTDGQQSRELARTRFRSPGNPKISGGSDGTTEMRFVPVDRTFAPYFIITSKAYEPNPAEMVQYQVVGNNNIDANGPATIDVLSIAWPDDALITFRT
jgi:hypothetical protein